STNSRSTRGRARPSSPGPSPTSANCTDYSTGCETSGSRSSASTRSISDPAWHRLPHGARTTPARSARGPARRRLAARLGRHRFDPGHTVVRSTAYSTKGTTMSTTPATAIAPRRELAQRAADGVEVTLYWDSICDSVAVEVRDASSEKTFEITV